MKVVFSILISIFLIFLFIGNVSADYYEYIDPFDGTEFYNPYSNYYRTSDPNQIVIEFDGDGSYYVYAPADNYYDNLLNEIYQCIYDQTGDSNANVTTLKNEVKKICQEHGIDNPDVIIKSPYGDDTFLYMGIANGISMEPTIKNGDMLVLNKTHDFQVGDIVSAYYHPKHIDILKRVATINGDEVYLISDNVNGTYVKNNHVYEYEGLRTWVNMSDINGVLIDSYQDDNSYYNEYNEDVILV